MKGPYLVPRDVRNVTGFGETSDKKVDSAAIEPEARHCQEPSEPSQAIMMTFPAAALLELLVGHC